MKIHYFHLMPYPFLPDDFERRYRSVWVDVPPALLEAERVPELYGLFLDQLLYADEMGFDGICVNEHHACAYGLMPSPNLMAAVLARQAKRAAIVVLGNSIALYNPPVRVAEEMAMLDLLSGGRLVAGFPVGTSADTNFAYGLAPATLRARYTEAHDLILRAWTATEPFAFNGKFTQLRYVNPWPRPLQRPHPPIWIPGGGSVETWRWVARRGYLYCHLSYFGYQRARRMLEGYWNTATEMGLDDNPYRVGYMQVVAVSDNDLQAEREYAEAAHYLYRKLIHVYPPFTDAPGYRSPRSLLRSGAESDLSVRVTDMTWRDYLEAGFIVAGSPRTVIAQLREMAANLRVGHLMLLAHFGNMSPEVAAKNTRLLATEVLPALRPLFAEYEDRWWPSGCSKPAAG